MKEKVKGILMVILVCIAILLSVASCIAPFALCIPWIIHTSSLWGRVVAILKASGIEILLAASAAFLWTIISFILQR